jgi:nucleoside phosphorylase
MKYAILVPTKFEADKVPQKIKDSGVFFVSGVLRLTRKKILGLIKNHKVDKIILLGFCGDLMQKNRLGQAFNINKVCDGKNTMELKTLKGLKLKEASCITSIKPVYTDVVRKKMAEHAELVEMECWWAAQACKENNVDFHSIRIVSDECNSPLGEYFDFKKGPTKELLNSQKVLNNLVENIIQLLS